MDDCGLNGVRCVEITEWDKMSTIAVVIIGICLIVIFKQLRDIRKHTRR